MHEAAQHRQFVKRLHLLIHSQRAEAERTDLAGAAVRSYAAALDEAAAIPPQGELHERAYVEFHLIKAQNWVVAWRSLADPADPATVRVCEAAMWALDEQRHRRHARAA